MCYSIEPPPHVPLRQCLQSFDVSLFHHPSIHTFEAWSYFCRTSSIEDRQPPSMWPSSQLHSTPRQEAVCFHQIQNVPQTRLTSRPTYYTSISAAIEYKSYLHPSTPLPGDNSKEQVEAWYLSLGVCTGGFEQGVVWTTVVLQW